MRSFRMSSIFLSAGLAVWTAASASAAAEEIACDTTYVVKEGDTLSMIAVRAGLEPEQFVRLIFEANRNHLRSSDLIFPGQRVMVPCEFTHLSKLGKPKTGTSISDLRIKGILGGQKSTFRRALRVRDAPAKLAPSVEAAVPDAAVEGGRASRIFSGPGQFPPKSFGAYAIVAFKSEPLESDQEEFARYRAICEGYVHSIPSASEDRERWLTELVTVWPMKTDESAKRAMQAPRDEQCEVAARQYGIDLALDAIRDARIVSGDLADDFAELDGPFLLAWNPASKKGEPDALILRMDLSWVRNASQAKRAFGFWVQRIETNTDLWLDDWERRPINQIVADTADNWGQAIIDSISFLIGKKE